MIFYTFAMSFPRNSSKLSRCMPEQLAAIDFPMPSHTGMLSNQDILFGAPMAAIDRLKIFSPDQFEDMTREWVTGYLMKTGEYVGCKKCSGSGDMGRDVIANVDDTIWDNFQCKRYDAPLSPSSGVNSELGKLMYYTWKKMYTLPRRYYFVSPEGAGPAFNQLIENPANLKQQLLDNWDKHCKDKIGKQPIEMTDELRAHIGSIDFSIILSYDPQQLIDEHAKTLYYAARFGGGLQKRRNVATDVPMALQIKESVYTGQLLAAYTDFTKKTITAVSDLTGNEELENHFNRQRLGFYSADSLDQFSRDTLPPDVDYFEDLKNEFYTGVIDIAQSTYGNGYERVKATTNFAKSLAITASPLVNQLRVDDRVGICHHLANENRLTWVQSI